MKAYRCGSMYRAAHRSSIPMFNFFFDRVAPEGRVLRNEAIYASPTRIGLETWIPMKERRRDKRLLLPEDSPFRAFCDDTLIRHIELVDDGSLFVYDSDLYVEIIGEASMNRFDNDLVDAMPYWDSGLPLSEWLEKHSASSDKERLRGELLVAPRHVQRVTIESTGLEETFDCQHPSLLTNG